MAGLATGDIGRVRVAEASLLCCMRDPAQLAALTGSSLCHAWGGLVQIASLRRADGAQADRQPPARRLGLLEGAAGAALALHAAAGEIPPGAGWDAFLLIS